MLEGQEIIEKLWSDLNTFWVRKTTVSSTFLIRLRVSGCPSNYELPFLYWESLKAYYSVIYEEKNSFIIRFGNLLLETGTLLLVGRRVNKTVSLLPQVAKKLKNYFDKLPLEPIDRLFFDSEFWFAQTLPLQKYCLHFLFLRIILFLIQHFFSMQFSTW